jgi:energy-coupling factor transporter transmembrane protein EcfT
MTSLCFILFFFAIALFGAPTMQMVWVMILLSAATLIRKRKQAWKKIALYILPIGILLLFINSAFGAPFARGLAYALRFVLLITPLVIVIVGGSPTDFRLGLRSVPIPSRLQYLFIFSFEIIHSLRDVFHAVYIGQQLRGYHVDRSFRNKWKHVLPLLLPVTLIAISQSLDRSLAFEFKGIESPAEKVYLRTLTLSPFDKLSIAVLLLSSVGLIVASIFLP